MKNQSQNPKMDFDLHSLEMTGRPKNYGYYELTLDKFASTYNLSLRNLFGYKNKAFKFFNNGYTAFNCFILTTKNRM